MFKLTRRQSGSRCFPAACSLTLLRLAGLVKWTLMSTRRISLIMKKSVRLSSSAGTMLSVCGGISWSSSINFEEGETSSSSFFVLKNGGGKFNIERARGHGLVVGRHLAKVEARF